jgi:hypothetical protein
MRRGCALAAATVAALAATGVAGPAYGEPSDSQKVFTQSLIDDPGTSAGVKRLLTKHQAIVDPRSGFLDVTGDGRQDALILVNTTGAAGDVALYVFSTHGQSTDDQTQLKVVFRLQSLYRATLKISGTTLSVLEPKWQAGDDLCCPTSLRRRDYRFDGAAKTFRRVADTTVAATS